MQNLTPILFVVLWFLAGCSVGPNYHESKVESKPAFSELNKLVNTNEPVAEWWKEFHDPELNKLVGEALKSNIDLRVATTRIRESRFQRSITAADFFPTVDADSSFTHSRGSKNVILPLGGSETGGSQSGAAQNHVQPKATSSSSGSDEIGGSPLNTQPSPFGQGGLPGATTDLYQVGFDASWEIDVFGGKRRAIEAAGATIKAASESEHDLQVSLAAEVARDYLELRGSQERLRIARETLASQKEIWELTKSKRKVGLTDDLDVERAAAQLAATGATIPPLEANWRRQAHMLATLIGKEPDQLIAELVDAKPLPPTPPTVPIGLPSQLIKRRPDIRQAEQQIAAATARIGTAQADLFPKFALVGSAGLDSSSAANLFNWESRYFLISPTVSWRIFDSGRIMANIRLQRANGEEATLQYQNTILKALREVEDALVTYAAEQSRRSELEQQMQQNQRALDLAHKRYVEGITDFLTVLDAERTFFSAQDQFAESTATVSSDLVALYKSLGGGWK